MILLKANSELKTVFGRMIKAMGANVTWTGNFVVLNNFLILSGNVRSLIFNFDNRKVITNVIELPDREEDMEPVGSNDILTNVLNMTLYAFGKWGVIRGLKVDQDYSQLNDLFCAILKEVKVTPGFRDDYFRFYKNNIQMTYEEVVQAAVEEGKRKAQEAGEEEAEQEEEQLGLWHKICWSMEQCRFSKSELTPYEKQASRLGNNFYRTGFHCAQCGEKLFMVVYPEGQEFPVETEEGKVYLARSYTCDNCNTFYTPRPGKLLKEGDVYTLKFGSDRKAYEDYQELLGSSGERTSNYHFNEYEWERGKKKEPETIEEACADMEDMSEEELQKLDGKLEAGFYPQGKVRPYRNRIQKLLQERKQNLAGEKPLLSLSGETKSGLVSGQKPSEEKSGRMPDGETTGKAADKKVSGERKERNATRFFPGDKQDSAFPGGKTGGAAEGKKTRSIQNGQETGERKMEKGSRQSQEQRPGTNYEARMQVLDRMSPRQLKELKQQVEADTSLDSAQKADYSHQIAQAKIRKEEEALRQKAKECQDKPYGVITRTIQAIADMEAPEPVKAQVLEELRELKRRRGQAEAEQLMASMPEHMNRNQCRLFQEKLAQYDEDVDTSSCQARLEEKRSQAQKLELDSMLRRLPGSDRKGLMSMLNQLKEGFAEEHAAPVRKQIEDRLRKIDEAAIDKLCPNILTMTFDEAAEAYEKVEQGAFLPEIKTNTLEMIDKRLTKLKMDECALLAEKLQEELKGKVKDTERLHFYEPRKVMRGDWEPEKAELFAKALNTYATDRSRYEYPILLCDSSNRKNGKEGFLLTPDHIFYNSAFNSEKIPVRTVTGIEGNTGLLNRGIYVKRGKGVKTKIPGGIPAKELGAFGNVLDQFVAYLQEKPQSRSISYLAKETHEIKCCYRCGFTYQGGNVCPKCGNQANQ